MAWSRAAKVWGGLAAVIAGIGAHHLYKQRKRKVFVSYKHPEDAHMRNLLMALDKNAKVDFDMELVSPTRPLDSEDPDEITEYLVNFMKDASCILVLIGENTAWSQWIDWEVAAARQLELPIVAVKQDRTQKGPPSLYSAGARWVNGFIVEDIIGALRQT